MSPDTGLSLSIVKEVPTGGAMVTLVFPNTVLLKKFGRYPHRNDALKRESTVDEIDFLSSKSLASWMKKSVIKNDQVLEKSGTTQHKTNNTLNILVLHSHRQTGAVFRKKTEKYFGNKLKTIANLTYCDAPSLYEPAGEVETLIQNKEYYLGSNRFLNDFNIHLDSEYLLEVDKLSNEGASVSYLIEKNKLLS